MGPEKSFLSHFNNCFAIPGPVAPSVDHNSKNPLERINSVISSGQNFLVSEAILPGNAAFSKRNTGINEALLAGRGASLIKEAAPH